MAFTENGGAAIYWDQRGDGDPLLLLMGLGYSSEAWHRMRPGLAERYRTVALDNRGTGRTTAPDGAYTIAAMAEDARAVLDAADAERAHVFGMSMGGLIAQQLALDHPERVASLILGCTPVVGPDAVRPEPDASRMVIARAHMPPEEAARAAIPFVYHPRTPASLIEQDLDVRRPWFPRPEAYRAQLLAMLGWESYRRVGEITAPALVIHGELDRLVPAANAAVTVRRIPHARLVLLERASHTFTTDQPEAALRTVLAFLADSQAFRADAPARPRG